MTALHLAALIGLAFLAPMILCAGVMLICGSPQERAAFFVNDNERD